MKTISKLKKEKENKYDRRKYNCYDNSLHISSLLKFIILRRICPLNSSSNFEILLWLLVSSSDPGDAPAVMEKELNRTS